MQLKHLKHLLVPDVLQMKDQNWRSSKFRLKISSIPRWGYICRRPPGCDKPNEKCYMHLFTYNNDYKKKKKCRTCSTCTAYINECVLNWNKMLSEVIMPMHILVTAKIYVFFSCFFFSLKAFKIRYIYYL